MKRQTFLNNVFLHFVVFISFYHSNAKQTQKPNFHTLKNDNFSSMIIPSILCFLASSISSAGGIGGGGLFIPILTILANLDLKTASGFSAFMVTGGSVANVIYNTFIKVSRTNGETLIDYDIALLSEPCMLLGVSVGVICNVVFPEWLITVLFDMFLAWSTFKTCKTGMFYWKLESENGHLKEDEGLKSVEKPLLGKEKGKLRFPWKKLGVLLVVWLAFFVLYLLRGSKYGQIIRLTEPCGVGYWIITSFQIPVTIIFTAWILYKNDKRDSLQDQFPPQQVYQCEDLTKAPQQNNYIFPIMALLAGTLGGVFGIGGGMLISPLLLQVGVGPEVTAATCSFMVFFSSIMSAIQYLLLGMDHIETALVLSLICFLGSLVGLVLVQKAVQQYGRASLIIFSVGIVMALSTLLMSTFEAIDIWRDYTAGKDMGFSLPC